MASTTHLVTADELLRLSEEGCRYELIEGVLLTMSPTKPQHGRITAKLTILLGHHVLTNNLGTMYAAETGFKLQASPDTVMAPDIAFVRQDHDDSSDGYSEGAPDLVVEVLSPTDSVVRAEQKSSRWLQLGASVVWIVNPKTKTVSVHRSNGGSELLAEQDELTGGELVPGFCIRVSEIFSK